MCITKKQLISAVERCWVLSCFSPRPPWMCFAAVRSFISKLERCVLFISVEVFCPPTDRQYTVPGVQCASGTPGSLLAYPNPERGKVGASGTEFSVSELETFN